MIEAAMVVPEGSGLTGWAALRWMGGRWFEGKSHGGRIEEPVAVATGRPRIRPQRGIETCEDALEPADLVLFDGLPLTIAARSTLFAMRTAPTVSEAVVVGDMSACSDLTSIVELSAYLADLPPWAGLPQARAAVALMHENSWSPMETRLRVLWRLEAGLPPLLVNAPVFDLDGRHLGTPDLLDEVAGLILEYDGADPGPGRADVTAHGDETAPRSLVQGRFRQAPHGGNQERRSSVDQVTAV